MGRPHDADLSRFVPELEHLCKDASDDTSGLPEADYVRAWTAAADDPALRAAQDEIVDHDYFGPAMALAKEIGLGIALGRAQLYDAAIQHGAGNGPDGLAAMVKRTVERVGSPGEAGERAWLRAFMAVRIETLRNPANRATAEAWRKSVDRVECFRRIAASGNLDLRGPITFTVYGDEFTIA